MSKVLSVFVRVPHHGKDGNAPGAAASFAATALQQLNERDARAVRHPTVPWLELRVSARAADGLEPGRRLSAELHTEVVSVVIDTAASVFALRRFVDGIQRRAIRFVGDGPWEVEGEAESWESQFFPDAQHVDEFLEEEFAAEQPPMEPETQALLRSVFAGRRIVAGIARPSSEFSYEALAACLGVGEQLVDGFGEPIVNARLESLKLRSKYQALYLVALLLVVLLFARNM